MLFWIWVLVKGLVAMLWDLTKQRIQLPSPIRPAAVTPASAAISSLSEVSPDTPTAPKMVPSASLINTPPGIGTRPPSMAEMASAKKWGRSFASFSSPRVPMLKASAALALARAMSKRAREEPSAMEAAFTVARASRTTMPKGLQLEDFAWARAAAMMVLALVRGEGHRDSPIHKQLVVKLDPICLQP